jgi:hypothetical protein
MDTVTLIGIVMAVTELIKKAFLKYLKVDIKGSTAIILAVLVSIGTMFVQALKSDITISFALIPTLIQVIIGSTIGYSIVTKKSA